VVGEVHSDWGWGLTGGPLDYTEGTYTVLLRLGPVSAAP